MEKFETIDQEVRGTSEPDEAWDFAKGAYKANFSEVKAGIYSGYYFTGYNIYKLGIDNVSTTGGCTVYYGLLDMDTNKYADDMQEVTYTSAVSGKEIYKTFYALDFSHKYCVFIRTNSSVSSVAGYLMVSTVI